MNRTFPILIEYSDKSKSYSPEFQTEKKFDAAWKNVLKKARSERARVICRCHNSGQTPLNIRHFQKSDSFFLAKDPRTGHKHRSDCRFFEIADEQSGKQAYLSGVIETKDNGNKKIRLAFGLDIRDSEAKKQQPKQRHTLSKNSFQSAMSQLGLLHLLWEEARLNHWHPKMEGKRSPSLVSHLVRKSAEEIQIGRSILANHLMVSGVNEKGKKFNESLWKTAVRERKRIVIISDLVDHGSAEPEVRVDDFPGLTRLHIQSDFQIKIRKRFETALRHWQAGNRTMMIAQIEPESNGSGSVLQWGLMAVTQNWIPVESEFEALVAEKLVKEKRHFIKPLRFDSDRDVVFPDFLLTDTGAIAPLPMEVFGMRTETYLQRKKEKEAYYAREGGDWWSWDVPGNLKKGYEIPPFPSTKSYAVVQ